MYFGKTQNARPGRVFNDDVEWAGIIGCRADLAGLERRSFMMGNTFKLLSLPGLDCLTGEQTTTTKEPGFLYRGTTFEKINCDK